MSLPPLEQGIKLVKDKFFTAPENSNKGVMPLPKVNKPTATTFRDKLVKSSNSNSTVVSGRGPVKTGAVQKPLCLHIKVFKGGNITSILNQINRKKSVTNLQIIELSSTSSFKTYQLKMRVDFNCFDFWRKPTFWPNGVDVSLWKGSEDYSPRVDYFKRILLSNISGVSAETITRTVRSVFNDIQFKAVSCERISHNKAVMALKFSKIEFYKFKSAGLRYQAWPKQVNIRCLRKYSIQKRDSKWSEAEILSPEMPRCESVENIQICDSTELICPTTSGETSDEEPKLTTSVGVQTMEEAGSRCVFTQTPQYGENISEVQTQILTTKPTEVAECGTVTEVASCTVSTMTKLPNCDQVQEKDDERRDAVKLLEEREADGDWTVVDNKPKNYVSSPRKQLGKFTRVCRWCKCTFRTNTCKVDEAGMGCCLKPKCQDDQFWAYGPPSYL